MKAIKGAKRVVPVDIRTTIIMEARRAVDAVLDERLVTGGCLWLAFATMVAAKRRGIDLVLQAGSARFLRVPKHLDDGVCNTHFSYEWNPALGNFAPEALAATGMLPEMHVWLGNAKTQEIVDATANTIPLHCVESTGEQWLTPAPPDFLWQRVLPEGWSYEPNRAATLLAAACAQRERLIERFGRVGA